jgi:predicted exporter
MESERRGSRTSPRPEALEGRPTALLAAVSVIFFASGFPALVYQLVWQRALFAIYGINVESVTVVVTAFMLGLGLGSLAGGVISRIRRLPLLF